MMNTSRVSFGASFGLQNSPCSFGEDIQEQRKRKRMISNRESARRSRMRKQKYLDEMMTQLSQLRDDNTRILENINIVSKLYENVEAENYVLKAQMSELTHRLQSLDAIFMNCMMNFGGDNGGAILFENHHQEMEEFQDDFLEPWNMINNQGIMALADGFMY